MCFDISINKEPEELEERFDASFQNGTDFEKIYHVSAIDSPSLPVLISDDPSKFRFYNWGLIPHWVKDPGRAEDIRLKTVNARAESIFERPSFRGSIKNKRCLVIADGFFEWREVGGKNFPYYIKLKDNDAFAFAGIWDEWKHKNDLKRSFSIITIEANPLLAKIHNKKKRMPVILEDETKWLERDIDKEEISEMLKSYDQNEMEAYPVRRLITDDVDDNVPEVLEPYEYEELDFQQETLF
ncbi:MAG: SOS response-associated peptidase [Candidatus Saliniplasma sp.]